MQEEVIFVYRLQTSPVQKIVHTTYRLAVPFVHVKRKYIRTTIPIPIKYTLFSYHLFVLVTETINHKDAICRLLDIEMTGFL